MQKKGKTKKDYGGWRLAVDRGEGEAFIWGSILWIALEFGVC